MLKKLRRERETEEVVAPFANIYEKENAVEIAVEMPGVDKRTLEVDLERAQLIIRGRRRTEEVGKEFKPIYEERAAVTYERRFEINTEIDRDKIRAEYRDGVLKVTLPKAEAVQPKKIPIQTK